MRNVNHFGNFSSSKVYLFTWKRRRNFCLESKVNFCKTNLDNKSPLKRFATPHLCDSVTRFCDFVTTFDGICIESSGKKPLYLVTLLWDVICLILWPRIKKSSKCSAVYRLYFWQEVYGEYKVCLYHDQIRPKLFTVNLSVANTNWHQKHTTHILAYSEAFRLKKY